MRSGIAITIADQSDNAVPAKTLQWLILAMLVSLLILLISTANIPANPFGGLASELYLAEIAAILSFYLIARSRSVLIAAACFIVLPTIQAILIYGVRDSLNWVFDILLILKIV